ncbi:hypothetical protein [Sodalis-like endosymbiont of Proechinophthirus fluctus]|uniref:hypothetical protein n=1 Tax=Sodalis-like endosymbiont of Proechinophthirus fluctus TaxID=1462730 RepID=UPI001FCAF9A5|nr:hypothetical protein [Sodalis-like endosymbiont of Proechinophthirus fluctus]
MKRSWQLVYKFPLQTLAMHNGSRRALRHRDEYRWQHTTFFNFLTSHDSIGVNLPAWHSAGDGNHPSRV